jgi:hypothetical protein
VQFLARNSIADAAVDSLRSERIGRSRQHGNSAQSERAMEAMLRMKKLDIAALERA